MSRQSYPFDVRSRDLLAIALPASVAFITEPLAGLVGITVIGRLGDASLLGGLVLGALVFDFIFSLAYFLRIGTAGLTAQSVGARDPRDGLLHAARAIGVGVAMGVLLIALAGPLLWVAEAFMAPPPGAREALAGYFGVRIWVAPFALVNYALLGWFYGRAAATTGMALQILIHGVNITLSLLFVYGFGWGVEGVALAAVIGDVAACLAGLALLVRHFGGLRAIRAQVVPTELFDIAALRRMLAMSRDLMIRSIAIMGAYAWFAAQGSRMGEVPLGANAILLNFLMISAFFLDGLAQGAEQLCGRAVGANWRPAFDRAYALAFRWGVVIAAVLTVVWYLAGTFAIDFMTTSAEVRDYAHAFLWVAALSALTGMPAFVYDGILIGVTLNVTMRNGMVLALLLFLAASAFFQPLWGNAGLWVSLHLFFLARGAYYWFALRRRQALLFA